MSRKRVQDLLRNKARAQEAGNLKEEARACGQLGEQYTEDGRHEDALRERQCELVLCEATHDQLGMARAHRMIGECLCSLDDYESALKHQRQHLEISKQLDNLVEQQRALATIGRTLFMCGQQATDSSQPDQHLVESLQVYLKSLEVCNQLDDSVGRAELLEMKSRLFLNIGLVYEAQHELPQAQKFLEQACHTIKDCQSDTLVLCQLSLGSVLNDQKQVEAALESYRSALNVAKQIGSGEHQLEALELIGVTLARLGKLVEGRKSLQQAYRLGRNNSSCDITNVRKHLMRVTKLLRLQEQVKTENDVMETIKMYDRMGDLCHSLKAHQMAISCYLKELKLMEDCDGEVRPVLVSLAMSYTDVKDYDSALSYYERELHYCHGNPQEECTTWTNIARIHDNANHDYNTVMTSYQRALSLAKMAENNKHKLTIYKQIRRFCSTHGHHDDAKHAQEEISKLDHMSAVASDDSDTASSDSDTSDVTITSSEEGNTLRRPRRGVKLDRRNEKGETPLHVAAISGNAKLVLQLIEKGAEVNTRDHCGWLPLHEACNHGYLDVVEVLLDHGACINDPGGNHCDGITPLHDATVNGQTEVVRLLLDRGADVTIVDRKGRTPLDIAMDMYDSNGGDFEQVVSLLRDAGSRLSSQQLHQRDGHQRNTSSNEALVAIPTSPNNSKEEWLIDDMPAGHKKRRTSHDLLGSSRKRSRDVIDEGDYPNYDNDDCMFVEGNYPNEGNYRVDGDYPHDESIYDQDDDNNNDDITVANDNQNLNNLRVTVKIGGHTFLVPCDSSSTIGWLCSVVAQRYASLEGRCPQLTLSNQNGALLAEEDLANAVVNNGECLNAHVISWTTHSLVDIYRHTSSSSVNSWVLQKLSNLTSSNPVIDLSDCSIRATHFVTIVTTLSHHSSLTTLNLCGNRLSCSLDCLATLPNLTTLDLSTCGLTHVHMTPGRVESLCHLSLGHNTFGRDNGVALATYLSSCDALQHLSLTDCSLDHMISPSLWHSITKMKKLRHLDISYNLLNSALQHVPIAIHLNYINLSATVSHDPSPIVSLLKCKLQNHAHVQQLIAQSCYLGNAHVMQFVDTLKTVKSLTTIDLYNNNVTMETINTLSNVHIIQ